MKVLFYAASASKQGKALWRVIKGHIPAGDVMRCHSLSSLLQRLSRPLPAGLVLVLCFSDRAELTELVAVEEVFRGRRAILVLPDDDDEIAALGHVLRPRFIAYADSDFSDVLAVLGRMLEKGRSASEI